MKKTLLFGFLAMLLVVGMVSASSIDATFNSNGGEVTSFVKTSEAYSEFHGEGNFKGTMIVDVVELARYENAPWAKASDSVVLNTEVVASSLNGQGASYQYFGSQEFQKGMLDGSNLAAVTTISASGDHANMHVGFLNTENRATVVGYDGDWIVRAAGDESLASLALFNIAASKLHKDLMVKSNHYVVSEAGATDDYGLVGFIKTVYGQSAVAATHGHLSAGHVDFYGNNNVEISGDAYWRAYTDADNPLFYAQVANGVYSAVYDISS